MKNIFHLPLHHVQVNRICYNYS